MLGNLLILCIKSSGQKWKAVSLYDSFSTSHLNEGREGYFLHLIKSNLFTLTANFAFNSLKKKSVILIETGHLSTPRGSK